MTTAQRERPIAFSSPEVVAILDGRKTQVRRTTGIRSISCDSASRQDYWRQIVRSEDPRFWLFRHAGNTYHIPCPFGAVGDRLWVRETWQDWCPIWDGYWCGCGSQEMIEQTHRPSYRATIDARGEPLRWRPSIHMPRWASRILLEITDVRVQRLQEISCADAIAEGVRPAANSLTIDCDTPDPRKEFSSLWDCVNGKRPNASWDSNPWVWAITFLRITP